jgi:pseudaminic acid biosynthesis-associated methylase
MSGSDETARLEGLWAGGFGDDYVDRNAQAGEGRQPFWSQLLEGREVHSALEVGCNVGANLRWLAEALGQENVAGVDINQKAVAQLSEQLPAADLRVSPARDLPFDDGAFDLTFTTGVLIHQPLEELPRVMAEIVRCSRRYVLCGEYYAEELVEIPYRGQEGALFKQDFGALYQREHPELKTVDTGFLPASDGVWDDITWWLFEKQ